MPIQDLPQVHSTRAAAEAVIDSFFDEWTGNMDIHTVILGADVNIQTDQDESIAIGRMKNVYDVQGVLRYVAGINSSLYCWRDRGCFYTWWDQVGSP